MTSTASSASGPIHLKFIRSRLSSQLDFPSAWHNRCGSVKPARDRGLIPAAFCRMSVPDKREQGNRHASFDRRAPVRPATIWRGRYRSAASASSCSSRCSGLAWYFAATLFLIFAGMLLGVGAQRHDRTCSAASSAAATRAARDRLPGACRMLSGVVFLGGTTIAQQATVLSNTIKSQLTNVKSFLERYGVDTSYLRPRPAERLNRLRGNDDAGAAARPTICRAPARIASSGGAIVSQTFKVLLGTVSAVGNFFIVLFLGLAFAVQPSGLPRRPASSSRRPNIARARSPSSTASARRWSAGCSRSS